MKFLLAELRRRNVHRAAVFYAGAAWLLVQVATQVFPFFDIPNWAVRFIVIAVVIGFPCAMLFSWFYEWTPQGIRRESEIDHNESFTRETGKKLDKAIIAVLGVAVVLLLANTFVLHKTVSTRPDNSIAVLPLLNESGNPDDEYFSDGLSEELIAALLQIGDLKVIGRSSSFRFKSGRDDSRTIGEKLGATTLLEGTVRRQGERVRIVAQLVNAADGRGLWAQTYDREVKDIFAVQAEIAQAVASSLKLSLHGGAAAVRPPGVPQNTEAHTAYLQGHFYFVRGNLEDWRRSVGYFDEAIGLDPYYALAYAERSEAWALIADQSNERDPAQRAAARRDAEKAVALDPNLAEARAALGWERFSVEWRFDDALSELRQAQRLAPGNARAMGRLARVLSYMGQLEEAEKLAKLTVELEPLNAFSSDTFARILYTQGKFHEALLQASRTADLQPTGAATRRWQVLIAVLRGDGDTALREAQLEPGPLFRRFELALAHLARGDRPAADAALAELIEKDGHVGAYQIAQVYARRGDTEHAFEWLQRCYDQHDTGLQSLLTDPLMRSLRSDPRYAAMLLKVGLPAAMEGSEGPEERLPETRGNDRSTQAPHDGRTPTFASGETAAAQRTSAGGTSWTA